MASNVTESDSSASTDVPPGHRLRGRTATERTAAHGTDPNNEFWRKRNLLSLDGGGIRGFWTLLVLRRLVECIFREERRQAVAAGESQQVYHSFLPERYPRNVSQLSPLSQTPDDYDEDDSQRIIEQTKAILLCHYFDYIGGTSTGSLIAIMLGRFRMTVDDCIAEYKRMSHQIFRNPRWISQRSIGVPRPKYDASALEHAVEEVALRRCDSSNTARHQSVRPLLPMTKYGGTCQTFVTTLRKSRNPNGAGLEVKYLFRSYDHKGSPALTATGRQNTNSQSSVPVLNYGPAEEIEVTKAARAATAAPMYFEEASFTQRVGTRGQEFSFVDAGTGRLNNPTRIGLQEIQTLPGRHTIGAVVNVGTSRSKPDPTSNSIINLIKRLVGNATDTNIVAEEMEGLNLEHYWRYNDDKGINVELDECKPNHWFTKDDCRGKKTFDKIEDKFHRWASLHDNSESLEACARELVETRRGRSMAKSRWEQFAIGAHKYSCPHEDCGQSTYNTRYLFELHWHAAHSDEAELKPQFEKWVYQKAPLPRSR